MEEEWEEVEEGNSFDWDMLMGLLDLKVTWA